MRWFESGSGRFYTSPAAQRPWGQTRYLYRGGSNEDLDRYALVTYISHTRAAHFYQELGLRLARRTS